MNIRLESNAADLNRAIGAYIVASGKTVDEVLQKQGAKLGFSLFQQLKAIAPAKGSVRAERLAALGRGEGIKIEARAAVALMRARGYNDSTNTFKRGKKDVKSFVVKGKRLNFQALLVKREIARRESARAFTAQGSLFPRRFLHNTAGAVMSRKIRSEQLSKYGASFGKNPRFIHFSWAEFSKAAKALVASMTQARAISAASRAMRDVTEDIMEYVYRKMGSDALSIFGKGLR